MKLLLADDHTLFRDAMFQYIHRAEPDSEILLARDVHEVMELMEAQDSVDLVLLDLRMPGMDDLQGLVKFKEKYPETAVGLLSGVAEPKHVEEARRLGARAYIPKTLSGKALLTALHRVADGETYFAQDHNTDEIMPSYYGVNTNAEKKKESRGRRGRKKKDDLLESLTPREREVLTYLVRGASNKDIADDLGLKVVTIKLHVRGVCRKLNAKNRTQAAMIAHDRGWA